MLLQWVIGVVESTEELSLQDGQPGLYRDSGVSDVWVADTHSTFEQFWGSLQSSVKRTVPAPFITPPPNYLHSAAAQALRVHAYQSSAFS